MHPVVALFRRNEWATERMLEFCASRPEMDAAADSDVYGGIDALFNHIVSGETGYFRLVTGELPNDPVRHDEIRPLDDLRPHIRWLEEHWLATLQTERDPEVVVPYQRA